MTKTVSPAVRAVFFDAGGTLFRPHPSVGHVYSRVARKHGCAASPAWVEARFREEWRRRNGLARLPTDTERGEKLWWRGLVAAVFGARFPRRRFGRYFEELYDVFARPATWRLFPDALPTLRALRRRGFRVGVVSNWDSRLFRLCDGLGVSAQVEFVLASAVVGSVKPHRGIFQEGLRLTGVRAPEALHVGDSYKEDYLGALRAGLHARLIYRHGPCPEGAEGIRSLSEVCRVVPARA